MKVLTGVKEVDVTGIRGALERLGMEDRSGHKQNEFSGGQQRRVAIARALVGQPAMVLADQPTGALDPATGNEIMELFAELNQDGVTLIVITHDPEAARHCARHIRLGDGVLHEEA